MKFRETHYISDAWDIEDIRSHLISNEFIGIYWTLPASNRSKLPSSIEDAARSSFTIQSQRRLVLAVATAMRLEPLGECALQFSSDLGWTPRIDAELKDVLALSNEDTVLVGVDFQAFGWRTHHALRQRLRGTGLHDIRISAGMAVDLADHFSLNRHWDQRHTAMRKERRLREKSRRFQPSQQRLTQFHAYMRRRINDIEEWEDWSLAKKAEALNARALWTVSGLRWNSELVRNLETALFGGPDRPEDRAGL